jgi:CRISPR/Cas system-associated endonuclease Cas1
MTEKEKELFDWINNSKDPEKALEFAIKIIEEKIKELNLPN